MFVGIQTEKKTQSVFQCVEVFQLVVHLDRPRIQKSASKMEVIKLNTNINEI